MEHKFEDVTKEQLNAMLVQAKNLDASQLKVLVRGLAEICDEVYRDSECVQYRRASELLYQAAGILPRY